MSFILSAVLLLELRHAPRPAGGVPATVGQSLGEERRRCGPIASSGAP
jgi:hypothetical protein